MSRLVVWMLLLVACGRGSATPQPQKRDAGTRDANLAALAGPALYQHLCAPCHGADAKGYKADHAPSLVTSTFLESASDDFLRRSIIFGRPGTSMAAYGKEAGGPLDAAQVGKIVAWLREQGPAAKELPAGGTGDVTRGAAIYARDCAKCHGSRTARGEGVFLANARFLEAASDPFLRWAIVHGRPGTPMEPWAGKLSDQDIDDVVAYVRAFAQPAVVQMLPAPTGKEPLVIHPQGKDPDFTVRTDSERSYVTVDQVAKALADGRKMIIIDARPESEWRRVHVTGAVSMPYHDLTRLDRLCTLSESAACPGGAGACDRIPKTGTWILTYCACPHHLSGIVADELVKRGYKHVAVLDEGINEWHRRGYPVVAAPGVEPPPREGPQ